MSRAAAFWTDCKRSISSSDSSRSLVVVPVLLSPPPTPTPSTTTTLTVIQGAEWFSRYARSSLNSEILATPVFKRKWVRLLPSSTTSIFIPAIQLRSLERGCWLKWWRAYAPGVQISHWKSHTSRRSFIGLDRKITRQSNVKAIYTQPDRT